jgi:hypothetical protein
VLVGDAQAVLALLAQARVAAEQVFHDGPHELLVLQLVLHDDDVASGQHGLERHRRLHRRHRARHRPRRDRQREREAAAAVLALALGADDAAVQLDEPPHDGQAEP